MPVTDRLRPCHRARNGHAGGGLFVPKPTRDADCQGCGLSAAQRIRAKDGRTLTVDQARQLLETADGYRFEAAVVLALAYGMRRGEVLALHWSALDWKAGTLGVTRRQAGQGPRRLLGPPDPAGGQRAEDTQVTADAIPHSRDGEQVPATPGAAG